MRNIMGARRVAPGWRCASLVLALAGPLPAMAIPYTWAGTDGLWTDAAKWQPSGVPGAGDTAIIFTPSGVPTLNTSVSINALELGPSKLLGSGSLRVEQAISFSGSANRGLSLAQLINAGTAIWWSGNNLGGSSGHFLNLPGAGLDLRSDHRWEAAGVDGLVNQGLLAKTAGTGSSTLDLGFRNEGTVEVHTGRLVLEGNSEHRAGSRLTTANDATLVINQDALFRSGAVLRGNLALESANSEATLEAGADVALRSLAVLGTSTGSRLTLATGSLSFTEALHVGQAGVVVGPGELRVSGSTLFSGGGLSAGARVVAQGPLALTGTDRKLQFYANSQLVNQTQGAWVSGRIEGLNLVNDAAARFELQGDDAWVESGTLTNHGWLAKTGGSGRSDVRAVLDQRGTLQVQTGTLTFANHTTLRSGSSTGTVGNAWLEFGYGTHVVEAGAALSGNLRLLPYGGSDPRQTVRAGALFAANQLELGSSAGLTFETGATGTSGSFTSTGWLQGGGTLQVSGPSVIAGGGMDNTVRLLADGGVTLTGGLKQLWGGEIVNGAAGGWDSGNIEAGVRLVNKATFDIRGDNDWASGSGGRLVNEGTLRKLTGAAGDVTRINPQVDNPGRIEVQQGTLALYNAFTNAGWVGTEAGATFFVGDYAFVNQGTLAGNGRFARANGRAIDNAGTIAPGFSIGALTLDGALTQKDSGRVAIELSALGFDTLDINGSALLDGTLAIHNAGYVPVLGQTFRVIDYASRIGGSTFDAVVGVGFGAQVGFTALYAADHVDIVVSSVPEPGSGLLLLAGLGVTGMLALRRRQEAR